MTPLDKRQAKAKAERERTRKRREAAVTAQGTGCKADEPPADSPPQARESEPR